MKKIISLLSLGIILFAACSKSSDPDPVPPTIKPKIKADVSSINIGGSIGNLDSFNIVYDGKWVLSISSPSGEWLVPDLTTGTGNQKIRLTVTGNNASSQNRTAIILIQSEGNVAEKLELPIVQAQEKQWLQAAAFPGIGRRYASSFMIGSKFYVGLGSGIKDNAEQDLSDFWEYDLVGNTWTKKNDFPDGPRQFSLGFTVNGKGYIANGQHITYTNGIPTGTFYKDFWEYDPTNDSWTKVGTYNFLSENIVNTSSIFVVNQKAYLFSSNNLWVFDPADNSLTQKANAPETMLFNISFAIGDKGYVGVGQTGGIDFSKSFYEYNPVTDAWTRKADFPGMLRRSAVGFAIAGNGYVTCGESTKQISPGTIQYVGTNETWAYNQLNDKWLKVADYPGFKPFNLVGSSNNEKAIVGAGNSYDKPIGEFLKDFWIY
jgi:N-acetylneuraminic acid mutarotase